MKHLSGEWTNKKNDWVTLMENALGAFKTLKKDCLEAPCAGFFLFQ